MTAAKPEPTWAKTMANGQLGEARVRALLLERFHVMTRSVDMMVPTSSCG